MGKNVYFFVFFLLSFFAAFELRAQTSTTETQYFPSSVTVDDETIGRVASDGMSIVTSHFAAVSSRIIWTDPVNNNGYYFELDTSFYIYDLERIADTFFFCGRYDTSAVVGFFKESIFSTGAVLVEFVLIPEANILSKMEVYADPNTGQHIVAAVGTKGSYPNINSVIVTCEFGSTPVTCYPVSINLDRLYQDIAVTDNYIVAIGVYQTLYNHMALTIIDKNNLTQLNAFTPTETAGDMNSLMYSIKHLDKDQVAISTLVHHPAMSILFSSPVHVFDAASATFINSQRIPLLNKAAYYNEMLYYPEYNTLLLLQKNYYPGNTENSVIYYLDPYKTATYSALLTYDTLSYYFSLDRFPGKHFLATGRTLTNFHSFMIHDSQTQPKFDCLESDYEVIDTVVLPNSNPFIQLNVNPTTVVSKKYKPVLNKIISQLNCSQY